MFGRTLLASLLAAPTLAIAPLALAQGTAAPAALAQEAAPAPAPPPGGEAAAAPAAPAAPAAAEAQAYSTAETSIGALLDNPAAKAVLKKHVPQLLAVPSLDNARPMTLKEAQKVAGEVLTDKVLAMIDADLAKVSAGS